MANLWRMVCLPSNKHLSNLRVIDLITNLAPLSKNGMFNITKICLSAPVKHFPSNYFKLYSSLVIDHEICPPKNQLTKRLGYHILAKYPLGI